MFQKSLSGYLHVSLAICVLLSDSSYGLASQAAGIAIAPQHEAPGFLQVQIPEELAAIEEVYAAPPKVNPKLLIHIQTAHGSYEAQVQIRKLLRYLHEKYGFKLLFVEGAAQNLDSEYLKFFPDDKRNLELADYLARRGELTGVEYFLMDGPKDLEAVGIENAELYRENYKAFKRVYKAASDVDQLLGAFEQKMEMFASRVFSQDMRKILSEWRKFEGGQRDFLPYVERLAEEAKRVIGLDLESLFSQVEWPQVTRLLVLQKMEKDLKTELAQKEKLRVIEFLKSKDVAPEIIEAIEKLGQKRIVMSRTGENRLENLPRYLFERLVEEAAPKGFRFQDYPAFSFWAGYMILQSELDSRGLFDEIERIFRKILDELAVTELEKNLLELYRDEELLRKLLHLEVTRREWDRVVYRRDWIELYAMMRRLRKIGLDVMSPAGERAERNGGLTIEAGRQPLKNQSPQSVELFEPSKLPDMEKLEEVLKTAFHFYDLARERENVFYETIKAKMEATKTEKAILVTGGFHTEGLMEIFRQEEINFSVVTPRLTEQIDTSSYVTTMLENKPTMFDLATLEVFSSLQDAFTMEQMGGRLWRNAQEKLEAFVKIGKFTSMGEVMKILEGINARVFAQSHGFELVPSSDTGPVLMRIFDEKLKAQARAGGFRLDPKGYLETGKGQLLYMAVESYQDSQTEENLVRIMPVQAAGEGQSFNRPDRPAPVARSEAETSKPAIGRITTAAARAAAAVAVPSKTPGSEEGAAPRQSILAFAERAKFEGLQFRGPDKLLEQIDAIAETKAKKLAVAVLTQFASLQSNAKDMRKFLNTIKILEEEANSPAARLQPLQDRHPSVYGISNAPGNLTVATSTPPTMEQLEEMEGLIGLLAANPNQFVSFLVQVPDEAARVKAGQDYEELKKAAYGALEKAYPGEVLDDILKNRLRFEFALPESAVSKVGKVVSLGTGKLRSRPGLGKSLQGIMPSDYSVLLISSSGRFAEQAITIATMLDSGLDTADYADKELWLAEIFAAIKLSQLKTNAEKLKEQVLDAIQPKTEWNQDEWRSIKSGLETLVDKVLHQAIEEFEAAIKTAASA